MMAECKPGCSIRDLCILGDKKLTEETGKAYKKDKKIVKGMVVSIPTKIFLMRIFMHDGQG